MTDIVDIDARDAHPLRREILRDGTASDVVEFDGDDLPTTFHLGAREGGRVVAISTWLERPHPEHPGRIAYQLRGMATAAEHRGTGLSTRLLGAGVDRCAERGAELVWARARVAALTFYERSGFTAIGADYVDVATGIVHHDIIRCLD